MKAALRFLILIPIICSTVISIVFIGYGVYDTIFGVYGILSGKAHTEYAPGVKLLEALDLFLIAFLFLVFAIGFAQLFIPKSSKISAFIKNLTPDWLHVQNFTQLKLLLWDTLLTTMVVKFTSDYFKADNPYFWEMGILPVAILFIAIGRYFIGKGHHKS